MTPPQTPRRDGHWGPSRPLPSRPGGAPRPGFPATNIIKGASGGGGNSGGKKKGGLLGCAIAIPVTLATLALGAAMALSACQPRTPADTPRPMLSGRMP